MRSPAQAIVWEICAKNRWALLVAFGVIPFCALVQGIIPPGHEMVAVMDALSAMVTFVSLISVCCYTANDSRGRFSGFPSWMYTLPMRTSALVLCPMLFGALLVLVGVSLWEITICQYWNFEMQPRRLCWHVLLLMGTLISVQTLVWSLHRFRWIRIVALVAVSYVFLYVGLVGPLWEFSGGAGLWFGGVALATVLAAAAGIAGVERDRRGRWEGWTGKVLEWILDLMPRRKGSFTSPAQAQLWFEWRRRGFLMSFFFAVPLALALVTLPLPEALYLDRYETMLGAAGVLIGVLFIAGAIGGAVAKSEAWSSELSVHPIVATKPQSEAALVFAKMKSAAGITIRGWILFAVLSVPAILWCNHMDWPNEQARQFWPDFATHFPRLWDWLSNPIVILAIVVTTWHTMVGSMSLVLTGNKRQIVIHTWRGMGTLILLVLIAVWLCKEPNRRWVAIFFQCLPFVTVIFLGMKLLGTVRAFTAVKPLVSRRDFLRLLGLWVGVALMVVVATLFARAAAGTPSAFMVLAEYRGNNVVIDRSTSSLLWFFAVFFYFPSGEIPSCVLNLSRNRHR